MEVQKGKRGSSFWKIVHKDFICAAASASASATAAAVAAVVLLTFFPWKEWGGVL